ncbi:hypothetical protein ACJIZ3_020413 [Penstemon smallii]|uniref:PHD-type domain-containing protein n=1 Tax=Penstemon smallii TaxID=265156 RepID=A0ABD3SIN2_9LAMI
MASPFSSSGSPIKDQVTTSSGNSGHVFTNETEEGSFETKDSNRQCCISVKSRECHFNDDDLLVSVFLENKSFRFTTLPRRSSRLLKRWPNTNIRNSLRGNLSTARPRTVLSWLINSRIISPREGIQLWNRRDNTKVKNGLVHRNGILCICCNKKLSISEFKNHADLEVNGSRMNLVMGSGKPLVLCQLEAWSAEYEALKARVETSQKDDYLCGICGSGGNLVCCDNCPDTFHPECLSEKNLPEGSWYCERCCCLTCGEVVKDKDPSRSCGALKCSHCKNKYHEACVKEKNLGFRSTLDTWFCGQSCHEVYASLQSRIGFVNRITDEFSWAVLRCINGIHKEHSTQKFLALRSRFGRMDFDRFYTVVLEKKDVLVAVASIRIHGAEIAEMPFIATLKEERMSGLCRLLFCSIEELLRSLKVKKLLIPSHKELVSMWTNKFGFQTLQNNDIQNLKKTKLMLLPGSIWLIKSLQ